MRKDLLDRLARLETSRDVRRTADERPIDPFEAERVYRDLMLRASTSAPTLPADVNEAAKVYMNYVSGR